MHAMTSPQTSRDCMMATDTVKSKPPASCIILNHPQTPIIVYMLIVDMAQVRSTSNSFCKSNAKSCFSEAEWHT